MSDDNDLLTSPTVRDLERTLATTRHSGHVVRQMEDGRTSILALLHLGESQVLLVWVHLIVDSRYGLRLAEMRSDGLRLVERRDAWSDDVESDGW